MLFSLLKHHFDINITDTALKVSGSLYCFTTSISRGVENYFPRLWGTGISDAIFIIVFVSYAIKVLVLAIFQSTCTLVLRLVLATWPSN